MFRLKIQNELRRSPLRSGSKLSKSGFTLIEVVIVIVIISILVSTVLIFLPRIIERSSKRQVIARLFTKVRFIKDLSFMYEEKVCLKLNKNRIDIYLDNKKIDQIFLEKANILVKKSTPLICFFNGFSGKGAFFLRMEDETEYKFKINSTGDFEFTKES